MEPDTGKTSEHGQPSASAETGLMNAPATVDSPLVLLHELERRKRSWRYYLRDNAEELRLASITDFGETCVFALTLHTEYERVEVKTYEVPASRLASIRFYDPPEPQRPSTFHDTQQEFALTNTRRLCACPDCSGKGYQDCCACHGSGQQLCKACQGMRVQPCAVCSGNGTISVQTKIFPPCPSCGGIGEQRCTGCQGSGASSPRMVHNPCAACGGTGGGSCSSCNGTGLIVLGRMRMHCTLCAGSGRQHCLICGGTGQLLPTLQVSTCPLCGGSGTQKCAECHGLGRDPTYPLFVQHTCDACNGRGHQPCARCSGRGTETCGQCGGSGTQSCVRCQHEGKLLTYSSSVYTYFSHLEREDQVCAKEIQQPQVLRNVVECLATPGAFITIESLDLREVERQLGVMNDRMMAVTRQATEALEQLDRKARAQSGTALFQKMTANVVPISFVNVRLGKTARVFWLVGTRRHARPIHPVVSRDLVKIAGWIALGDLVGALGLTALNINLSLVSSIWHPLTATLFLTGLAAYKLIKQSVLPILDTLVLVSPLSSEKAMLFALLGYVVCDQHYGTIPDAYWQQLHRFLQGETLHSGLSDSYSLSFKKPPHRERLLRIINLNTCYFFQRDQVAADVLRSAGHVCVLLDAGLLTPTLDQALESLLEIWHRMRKTPVVTLIFQNSPNGDRPKLDQVLPRSCAHLKKFRYSVKTLEVSALQRRYQDRSLTDVDILQILAILENDPAV